MTSIFTGKAESKPSSPADLPPSCRDRQSDPAGYVADDGLVNAVNIALTLGQPLLLTGEPGTGKSQLAHRVAWELGFDEPQVFNTKSTSQSSDLFYTFDSLRRFHAAHSPEASADNRDYLEFNALGRAILLANEAEEVKDVLPPAFKHPGRRRSVVLVDELDKAPRDFPNDLLNEVDQMFFRIPELGNREVRAPAEMRPILVIASNSEKNLPDPFLRRCIYYDIPFPDDGRLGEIIVRRLDGIDDPEAPLLGEAISFFLELRRRGLRKKPSTAELLNWIDALLRHGADKGAGLQASKDLALSTLGVLAKSREDAEEATRFAKDHFGET